MADPIKTADGYTAKPVVLIDPVTGEPYSAAGGGGDAQALAQRLRLDAPGGYTGTQQAQGRANLGLLPQVGRHTIWVPAAAMRARTTNGPAPGTFETPTNRVMLASLDFDAATQEFAQFQVEMPPSWNEGPVQFAASWYHAATSINFGVVWGLQALPVSDGEVLDAAFGAITTVTDTGGAANTRYRSPESGNVAVPGAAVGDLVTFQISRVASDAADTLAVDADLLGIAIFFTTNAATDD